MFTPAILACAIDMKYLKINLPLSLFVLRVLANNANSALASNDLAIFANFLDTGSDLHRIFEYFYT